VSSVVINLAVVLLIMTSWALGLGLALCVFFFSLLSYDNLYFETSDKECLTSR